MAYCRGAVVGGLFSGVSKVLTNVFIDGEDPMNGVGTAILTGAASGALASTGVCLGVMIAGNAAISMAGNATDQIIKNKGLNNFDIGDMVIDGVVGAVSGATGGPGNGSKHLMNLGKQSVKRTVKTTIHKGVKPGLKEAKKAFTYYLKNTKKYYKSFLRSLPGNFLSTLGSTIATSKYMKNKYRLFIQ